MLEKWLPGDYTAELVSEIGKATSGYSGAHMRELARFIGIIMHQDGLSLKDAVVLGLAKLAEQRDLITAVQTTGSRYRAPEHVKAKVQAEACIDDLVRGDVCAGPFKRDEVGWKAFVKARNRAATKGLVSDEAIASLISDFGFEEEAVLLAAATEQPNRELEAALSLVRAHGYVLKAPGQAGIEKAGRVLSKANEDKLKAAAGAIEHAKDTIYEVLRTVQREEENPEIPDSPQLSAEAEEFGFDVETRAEDGDGFEFETEERAATADEVIEVDATTIQEAMREAFSLMASTIQDETRAAFNAARGRID
jgi:hypothetical protein